MRGFGFLLPLFMAWSTTSSACQGPQLPHELDTSADPYHLIVKGYVAGVLLTEYLESLASGMAESELAGLPYTQFHELTIHVTETLRGANTSGTVTVIAGGCGISRPMLKEEVLVFVNKEKNRGIPLYKRYRAHYETWLARARGTDS